MFFIIIRISYNFVRFVVRFLWVVEFVEYFYERLIWVVEIDFWLFLVWLGDGKWVVRVFGVIFWWFMEYVGVFVEYWDRLIFLLLIFENEVCWSFIFLRCLIDFFDWKYLEICKFCEECILDWCEIFLL